MELGDVGICTCILLVQKRHDGDQSSIGIQQNAREVKVLPNPMHTDLRGNEDEGLRKPLNSDASKQVGIGTELRIDVVD